jgi:hypothetical protein
MSKIIEVAVADAHPFKGVDHCPTCKALFFSRSRQKWENLQNRWALIRQRMNQTHQISPMIQQAVMTVTDEEKEEQYAAR